MWIRYTQKENDFLVQSLEAVRKLCEMEERVSQMSVSELDPSSDVQSLLYSRSLIAILKTFRCYRYHSPLCSFVISFIWICCCFSASHCLFSDLQASCCKLKCMALSSGIWMIVKICPDNTRTGSWFCSAVVWWVLFRFLWECHLPLATNNSIR